MFNLWVSRRVNCDKVSVSTVCGVFRSLKLGLKVVLGDSLHGLLVRSLEGHRRVNHGDRTCDPFKVFHADSFFAQEFSHF